MTQKNHRFVYYLIVLASLVLVLYVSAREAIAQTQDIREISAINDANSPPVIDIWYGPHQVFGQIGNTQQWVDILGNVSDPKGIASLTYSLNSGPELPLSVGTGNPRLVAEGDFHIELDYTELSSGLNQVVITAADPFNSQTVETVTVEYVSGNVWPETYSIDWSAVSAITQAAQIVDGLWTLEADSIRPLVIGYDRLVAIGDIDPSWDEYEVTVPITINEDPPDPTNGGVGILMRWQGHQGSDQPRTEWWHMGAYGYYRWMRQGSQLALRLDQFSPVENNSVQLDTGTQYNFKMRVQNSPGPGGLYSLKVWQVGQPEPSEWHLYAQDVASDNSHGSLLLVAHKVNASFGDVTIIPGPLDDSTPPIISNIVVTPTDTAATITWTTNEPAASRLDYGPTPAYGSSEIDGTLVTQHAIALTNLIPGSLYHYQVVSADGIGNTSRSIDLNFRTTGVAPTIVSDDFNTCGLNTQLWELVDPLGDSTLDTLGTLTDDAWVSISVPADVKHTMSGTNQDAPRIMQQTNDADFEIEAKFESALSADAQLQGVLIEQDNDNLMRFSFHSDSSNTWIYASTSISGVFSTRISTSITDTNVAPLYMRIKREGHHWTQSYSFDGEVWTNGGNFQHPLEVNKVGPFAGNTGANPAHTALIDYFFNTVTPIEPEDGDRNTLTVYTAGNGSVEVDPQKRAYACGEEVTLTATPDPGWTFAAWRGDVTGRVNPKKLAMTGDVEVTAGFVEPKNYLPVIMRHP